jgi:RNA polymerase sigma factor (TIGR02999 family)
VGADSRTTLLLHRAAQGDVGAADELLPIVYAELHRLARGYMRDERAQHTLQPTALVHEAWMRLFGAPDPAWNDRMHFVAVAARAMRQVLVDHARRRGADKRGGGMTREPLDSAVALFEGRGADLVELDEALQNLRDLDPDLGRIVELRFFGGATNAEIAGILAVSTRTVERGWRTAQAWLRVRLETRA